MTVAECIKCICETKGLSLRQLSEKAGYTNPTTISSMLLRNDGMKMSAETLIKILEAAEIQICLQDYQNDDEWILDGESEME